MDNPVFDVNGSSKEMLQAAIDLKLYQRYPYDHKGQHRTVVGWMVDPKVGLILLWAIDEKNPAHNKFITPLRAEELIDHVWAWLKTPDAEAVPLDGGWDDDIDTDGHNSIGWRVFNEGWGHVGAASWYAICGIKRVYLWHGK